MKKVVKYSTYSFIFFILLFQVFVNIFLLKNILNQFTKNITKVKIEYNRIFYIIPNIVFIKDMQLSESNYNVKVKQGYLFFNPIYFFNRSTAYVLLVNIDGAEINLDKYSDYLGNNFNEAIDEKFIKNILGKLPFKLKISNINFIYNKKKLLTNCNIKFNRLNEKPKIKVSFDSYGHTYLIKILADNKLNKWDMKIETVPSIKYLSNLYLDLKGEIQGYYNLTKDQHYKFNILVGNKKFITKGIFKFYPFIVDGKIDGDIFKVKYNFQQDDLIFKTNFNGNVLLSKIPFINEELRLDTKFNMEISTTNYICDLVSKSDKFVLNGFLKDGFGNIKIKKEKFFIETDIKLNTKNKILTLTSKTKEYPFNIVVNYLDGMLKKTLVVNGQFKDYRTIGELNFLTEEIFLNTSIMSNKNYLELNFLTNRSTGSLRITIRDKINNGTIKLFSDINYNDKKINLVTDVKDYNINNKKLNGILMCEIFEEKISGQPNIYSGKIETKDFWYNKTKLFEDTFFNLEIKNIKENIYFTVKDTQKIFNSNISYNLDKKIINGVIDISKKGLSYNNINFDLIMSIKVFGSIKNMDVSGDYRVEKIVLGKTVTDNFLSGKIFKKNKKIYSEGIVYFDKTKSDYKLVYDDKTKKLDMFVSDIKLLTKNKLNAELSFDMKNVQKNSYTFYGKIYDKESEVEILSDSKIFYKPLNVSLKARLKNFNIKNMSIIGNMDLDIKEVSKNEILFELTFSNYWINQFNFDNSKINLLYNNQSKQLNFFTEKNVSNKHNTLSVNGKIKFFKNFIEYEKFTINFYTDKSIYLDGKIGEDKNLLNIEFKNLPIDLLKNILNIPYVQIYGNIFASSTINTVLVKRKGILDKSYNIKSNFEIKKPKFYGLQPDTVQGQISSFKKTIFINNFILNFFNTQKIGIRGNLDLENNKIKLSIKSKDCDLSIFNNFAEIIKTARGQFLIDLKLEGDIKSPKTDGVLQITNGRIDFNKYLKYFDDVNVKINFNYDRLTIQTFNARFKNTNLRLIGLAKIPDEYNFKLFTEGDRGLLVNIPELSFPVGQFFKFAKTEKFFASYGEPVIKLNLVKKKKSIPKLTGEIVLEDTHFTYPPKEVIHTNPGGKLYYEIKINSGKNTWYENELISANISGGIVIRNLPSTNGEIVDGEIFSTSGDLNYLGTNFKLKNARVQVINNIVFLELVGETNIVDKSGRRNTINVIVEREKVSDVKPRLVSINNPNLKSEDLIALLMGLKNIDIDNFYAREQVVAREGFGDTNMYLRQQIIRLIDSNFTTPLARKILQRTGLVDTVSVSYVPPEEKNVGDPNSFLSYFKDTRYSFGKYLTPDILMGYSIVLGEQQNNLQLRHEIEVAYRLKGNLFLRGAHNFGQKDTLTGSMYGSETRVGIEPVWRFGGDKWEE